MLIQIKKVMRPIIIAVFLMFNSYNVSQATSVILLDFDFTSLAGYDAGFGQIKFEVDPDNLPFDSWNTLDSFNIIEWNFVIRTDDNNTTYDDIFYLTDLQNFSYFNATRFEIFIRDENPLYPVTTQGDMVINNVAPPHFFPSTINLGGVDGSFSGWGDNGFKSIQFTYTTQIWFDDPPTEVPEPMSLLLFGSGIAGLAGARLRKRKER